MDCFSAVVRGRPIWDSARFWSVVLVAGGLWWPSPKAAESIEPEVLTPAQVNAWVEVMATNQPSLRAARERARAATLNAQGVRAWADPKVVFGGSLFSNRGDDPASQGNLIYGVEQPLPLLGKQSAARAVASAEAETAMARSDARFQELRRDLAKALFQAALARENVQIFLEERAWLHQTVQTLETRLSTGNATTVEVLRLQTEHARSGAELETLRSRESAAQVTVNRLLGREPATPLPPFALPKVADPLPYHDNLVKLALAAEPRLRVLEAEKRTAAATVEATRRSQRPDLALGVEGRQYSGDGGFREGTFLVSVNVPWFNRSNYRRDLSRDRERLRAAEDEHADSALGIREEIHHLTLEIAAARREAELIQTEVLPRAQQTLTAALAQWSGGRGDLRDVLEARRFVLDARREYALAVTAQWSSLSELVLCCGLGDLEALLMVQPSDEASRTNTPATPTLTPHPTHP